MFERQLHAFQFSMPEILQYARAFNIDEQVRKSWREVAEYLDTEAQYTPG